jgi:hypothetical protein
VKLNLNSFCTLTAFLILSPAVFAADQLVPSVYPTIQADIDAAVNGDTVTVAQGTYYENIDVGGKSITLRSTDPNDPSVVAGTVIDAEESGTVVTFPDIESANCVLAGFTITGGEAPDCGGGICCWNATLTINNCIFTGNVAENEDGAGIFNIFSGNIAEDGGGVFNDRGHLTVINCTFNENAAESGKGGGIFSRHGELTLTGCAFIGNSALSEGGGVATDYNSVIVTNCTFIGNSARQGGGMNNSHWGATAANCVFSSNAAQRGGGICTNRLYLHDGTLRLSNCTFSKNVADYYGGAVDNRYEGILILTSCILWGNIANEGPQVAMEDDGTLSVSYSCLQGDEWDVYTAAGVTLDWGDGNIDADPCFADMAGGDYHLQSSAGRWDANASVWVTDDNDSPCIDAGDPCSDWTAELWPHGKRINMGAFGGTPQASKSQSDAGNIADLDFSGSVNWGDAKILTNRWLVEELLLAEDFNRDGLVDGWDFAIFADKWAWNE